MSVTTAASPADGQRPARRRLPFTLYALAGLIALKALLLFLVVAGASLADTLRPLLGFTNTTATLDAIRNTPGVGVVLVAFGILLLFSVVGILSRRRIGWLLAMVITGLFVAMDIYGFLNASANHLWMGLNILTVFYLNQRDVREVVGVATGLSAPVDGADVA
ncbi:MAG TPA: hypothetical protein VES19_14755 [Candidatus Limnocylindrales bacterium]|nr:hypothetical protein [Candidatus Limnocylindrales bacterium]